MKKVILVSIIFALSISTAVYFVIEKKTTQEREVLTGTNEIMGKMFKHCILAEDKQYTNTQYNFSFTIPDNYTLCIQENSIFSAYLLPPEINPERTVSFNEIMTLPIRIEVGESSYFMFDEADTKTVFTDLELANTKAQRGVYKPECKLEWCVPFIVTKTDKDGTRYMFSSTREYDDFLNTLVIN